ncbi:MAG TPA: hypothetical protein G4O07_04790 [Dehalococcoidia bacterium]|nr:hypothetical protein [Dehalococcoidia bacterium]
MVQVSERETKAPDKVFTIKPTPRVQRLRENFFNIERSLSIERVRIEARVMRETEGEPMITRRAKVFATVLREMPVDIYPDELIAGNTSVRSCCSNLVPGTIDAVEDKDRLLALGLGAGDLKELEEDLAPYWKQQGRAGRIAAWHYGHNIHDMLKVVKKGFLGIKQEAEDSLARLDLTNPEDFKKTFFLEGVIIVMEAAAGFGQRYAARAREIAEKEKDTERKAELLKLAEVCDRVPANPARTFYEALQSYHFAWLMLILENIQNQSFALGKMDQYLYPYYTSDIREGRITEGEAQELLDCYILKLNYLGNKVQNAHASLGVGGIKADGNDATNELSYMFIESIMHTRLADPWFAVHIHSKSPDDFLIKASELVSLGSGSSQFINSDVGIAQMLARGGTGARPVTLEDARAASNVGCLELVIPGKDSGYYVSAGTNLALAMELVMTNGISRIDGKKTGLETGDPRQFKSFEEVRGAFYKQLLLMRQNAQINGNDFEQKMIELCPTVYQSALISDCIENGICREEGGARYNNQQTHATGAADAGDSLASIKKLVFDDKNITMAQLCDALDHNFVGHEDICRMCEEVPKFGNDDDYADELVAWVTHVWASEFSKIRNLRGGYSSPGGSSMSGYLDYGKVVSALPSGRQAGEPLAPAACPSTGKDRNGVTAVLKSMGKLDNIEVLSGLALTTRIDPAVFKNKNGLKRMADLLRTFVDQQIFHIQFNVVSSETLKDAQKEPEKYRDLMVKVAGYNAYFTRLRKELQDAIIARTEHGL